MKDLIIHDYNVYNSRDELIGDGEKVTLPDLTPASTELSGSGILGSVKIPVPGMFESIVLDIPFRMLSEKVTELFVARRYAAVKIRGGILRLNESTGEMNEKGIVVTAKGMGSKLSLGEVEQGKKMGPGISIEAVYYKVEIDGKILFELDKFNNVYKVNGVDIMENLRKLC